MLQREFSNASPVSLFYNEEHAARNLPVCPFALDNHPKQRKQTSDARVDHRIWNDKTTRTMYELSHSAKNECRILTLSRKTKTESTLS